MKDKLRNNGFSLTEVLMAAGILAIGFAFIAGMFPVGVRLTALSTEQTIAPIVADEAIAKIKLYGDPNFIQFLSPIEYRDFSDVAFWRWQEPIPDDEFSYPSTDITPELKKYHWSALCRRDMFSNEVHVIVLVSRRAGAGARYLTHDSNWNSLDYGQAVTSVLGNWPLPVKVQVEKFVQDGEFVPKRLKIVNSDEAGYINRGSTIADDLDGSVYRVLKRVLKGEDDVIVLDRKWEGPPTGYVWVVPPAEGSGRNPCVRVDPTNTIRF